MSDRGGQSGSGNASLEVVTQMDELSDTLCQVADLAECVRLVHPDTAFARAAQEASLKINQYVEELNTDKRLHRSLNSFMKSEEFLQCNEVTQRTAELFMHDFEASGIHLDDKKREKVVDLNGQILQLSHQFVDSTTLPSLVPENQCPSSLRQHFRSESGNVLVNHVAHRSGNSELRALSYQVYHAITSTQQRLLQDTLSLRHELATLVGYPSFAHKVLKTCMAESPDVVRDFLESLSEKILPLAREEAQEMIKIKQNLGDQIAPNSLFPWDVMYISSSAQKEYFSTDNLRDYFSLDNTLKGLDNLFQSLFDVKLERSPIEPGEAWHKTVMKLAFVHKSEGLMGYTYLDLFARPGKILSDCHFTIQGGRELADGSYQLPIIVISCNFNSKLLRGEGTLLLSQDAVENFFHEMGHALHSMLGRPKYQNVTGTRCPTDFAEVPSTLMEFFLSDRRVLASFARHHQTGYPILESCMANFRLSSNPFPAFNTQTQVLYALTDLALHSNHHNSKTLQCTEIASDLYSEYSPTEPVPGTSWCLRFSHFYGYGARYYSYLWSRAVSSLIWKNCFSREPFSRDAGERLREMLQYGGGVHPKKLVREVLGFESSISDLVDTLCDDIAQHKDQVKSLQSQTQAQQ